MSKKTLTIGVKAFSKIQVLNFRPGDILVFGVPPKTYPRATVDEMLAVVKKVIPKGVKVLIKSNDIQLNVLRPKKSS